MGDNNNNLKQMLTMAEFKGKVLESLDNIEKADVLNREQHEMFFKRIRKLELRPSFSINPWGWLMAGLGFKR